MRSIKEDAPTPFSDDIADSLERKGKQGHRGSQRDYLGSNKWRNFAEEVEINYQLNWIKRDVYDFQATNPCRPVDAVARMTSEGLSNAHNDIARFSQRSIDRHIADHACHQPVVGITGTKRFFQQLDA